MSALSLAQIRFRNAFDNKSHEGSLDQKLHDDSPVQFETSSSPSLILSNIRYLLMLL